MECRFVGVSLFKHQKDSADAWKLQGTNIFTVLLEDSVSYCYKNWCIDKFKLAALMDLWKEMRLTNDM